jgi:mannose-6-phosphate isomerase-like protein (cupin superfamily)
MNTPLIETYFHHGSGYNPFFIKEHWQVAQLNFMDEQGLYAIQKMDMHMQTDEVFILTKGTAVLIAGELQRDQFAFELIKMKAGTTYNIRANLWHNIAMNTDAQVIIVEKSNTHLGDFIFRSLSMEEQENLNNAISLLLQNDDIKIT